MKLKSISALLVLAVVALSCTTETVGPQGPQGLDGPQGPQGEPGESAYVFEYTDVDFLAANNYEVYLDYPEDFEGFDSDVTLVYLLWDVVEDGEGNPLEVWRQVPQSLLTSNGLLMYNYDFSKVDVHLFLAAEFDMSLLEPIDTDDWIVRVVVIPGNFWSGRSKVDHSNYHAVAEAYGLPELSKHEALSRR